MNYSARGVSGSFPASQQSGPLSNSDYSSSAPAVRESRSTGNATGEASSETGPKAVRAADENEGAGSSRRALEADASDKKVGGLDEAELKELTELKARDREVRAHEAAHQAAGGQYAGAMSFSYQRGPDGAQYAVGGEVSIDISPVNGNPQATIEKMRVVRSAAMAPAEPSGQDRAVAAQAMQIMLQAQSELASEGESSNPSSEEPANDSDDPSGSSPVSDGDQERVSAQSPRSVEQARTAYQSVAGFGSGLDSPGDGFLPISV
nr:putative metalloprotease CJM1_0395 family protein [Marinobacter sp. S6332]